MTRFDWSTDLSTTYLGRIETTRDVIIKAEKNPNFWTSVHMWKVVRKHRMHALTKFASTMQRVQVGNGQCLAVLFVIPVVIDVYRHRFEVFTLVSEIHDNVDLVLYMKICLS